MSGVTGLLPRPLGVACMRCEWCGWRGTCRREATKLVVVEYTDNDFSVWTEEWRLCTQHAHYVEEGRTLPAYEWQGTEPLEEVGNA